MFSVTFCCTHAYPTRRSLACGSTLTRDAKSCSEALSAWPLHITNQFNSFLLPRTPTHGNSFSKLAPSSHVISRIVRRRRLYAHIYAGIITAVVFRCAVPPASLSESGLRSHASESNLARTAAGNGGVPALKTK